MLSLLPFQAVHLPVTDDWPRLYLTQVGPHFRGSIATIAGSSFYMSLRRDVLMVSFHLIPHLQQVHSQLPRHL